MSAPKSPGRVTPTIAFMLALGYTTRYSGLDATMGLAFARTGVLYPIFGTMLGWLGVAVGALGLPLRLWAVLTLRERYTRTLFVHENHAIERSGPYRFVRHPGYLGSLLTMNGIALATGNAAVLVASLVVTFAAYAHRIRVEDAMLVAAFGDAYDEYRREVRGLIPFLW